MNNNTPIDETKLIPCDAANMSPGDPVFRYAADKKVKRGRFIAYVPDAGPDCQMLVKYEDAPYVSSGTVDGRVWAHRPRTIFRGTPPYKPQTFRCGQWFSVEGDLYMLAQVDGQRYCLVGLMGGNRYSTPVSRLEDCNQISEETLRACGTEPEQLVEVSITIKTP